MKKKRKRNKPNGPNPIMEKRKATLKKLKNEKEIELKRLTYKIIEYQNQKQELENRYNPLIVNE